MPELEPRWVACAVVIGALATITSTVPMAVAALPDHRSYELVSPVTKSGADAMPVPSRTRAATNGDAIEFSSLTGFGGTLGMGATAEYVSRRDARPGTNGWATHPILPKVDAFAANSAAIASFDSTYLGDFSDDLSRGILKTGTNLSGDPNLATIANLYMRSDVLAPGTGLYSTVTPCPACVSPFTRDDQAQYAQLGDGTPDLEHVLFETSLNLVAGASGGLLKLYEWDHGTMRLAGILPDSQGGGMAPASIAGTGSTFNNYTQHTISDDGRRIFFTDNSNAFHTDGVLYMRLDHTTTIHINASERTDCADHDPCSGAPEPSGAQPARFQTASDDGTKVFFTTNEQLADQGGGNLYMYDASLPDSDPHNLTPIAGGVAGVLGASADGSYVYFLSGSQIISGQPPITGGEDGIFVWHEGALRYIGTLKSGGQDELVNMLGGPFALVPLGSRVTPDGRHLLFTSHSGDGLTGYDQSAGCGLAGCGELYLYSYDADALTCASCNPTGVAATTSAGLALETSKGAGQTTSHLGHALSDDGRYAFFTTGERLVPEDRNGTKLDAYEYDSATGELHLLSSGRSSDDSFFLDASASGRDVFFATRDRLVGWDSDSAYDIYDARVGGGLPEPVAAPKECGGDVCQGAIGEVPLGSLPLTSTFVSGNDDVRHAGKQRVKRCRRGAARRRVHGRVRCVAKKRSAHRRVRGTR